MYSCKLPLERRISESCTFVLKIRRLSSHLLLRASFHLLSCAAPREPLSRFFWILGWENSYRRRRVARIRKIWKAESR